MRVGTEVSVYQLSGLEGGAGRFPASTWLTPLRWRLLRPAPQPRLSLRSVVGPELYDAIGAVPEDARAATPPEHFLNYTTYEARPFLVAEGRDLLMTRHIKALAAPGLGLIDELNVGGAAHMADGLLLRDLEKHGDSWWAPDESIERVSGFSIPFCHYGVAAFGHFVLDALLQVFLFRRELANGDARLVHWPFEYEWMAPVLGACGVPGKSRRELTKPAALMERMGLSSALAAHGVYFPCSLSVEFIRWLREMFDAPPTTGERRLYLRRSASFGRTVRNAADLETLVARHGYEVVSPEELSFREQVQLIAASGSLISIWGSGLTLAPLLGGARHVFELLPASTTDTWFVRQAIVHGLDYDPLVIPSDGEGQLEIDLEAMDRRLASTASRLGWAR